MTRLVIRGWWASWHRVAGRGRTRAARCAAARWRSAAGRRPQNLQVLPKDMPRAQVVRGHAELQRRARRDV